MKPTNKQVEAMKAVNVGHLPAFLSVAHRHLEKEQPVGEVLQSGIERRYQVPLDLLSLTVPAEELLKDIESVCLTYRERAK